jgi:integrase
MTELTKFMETRTSFVLTNVGRARKTGRATTINMLWRGVNGKQQHASIGEEYKVFPDDWNRKRQWVTVPPAKLLTPEYQRLNERIEECKQIFKNLQAEVYENGDLMPIFDEELKRRLAGIKEEAVSPFVWFNDYIKRLDVRDKSKNLYFTVCRIFEAFIKESGVKIQTFSDFSLATIETFQQHLADNAMAAKTIQNYCNMVIMLLRAAERADLIDLKKSKILQFKKIRNVTRNDGKTILTATEFEALKAFDFTDKEKKIRDLYIFSCLTGLRLSDVSGKTMYVENGYLNVYQKKTDNQVFIPLTDEAERILNEYGGTLPYFDKSTVNKELKVIAEKAGICAMVYRRKQQGTQILKYEVPKFKALTFHSSRHYFVASMISKGATAENTMKQTGHTDLKTFQTYYNSLKSSAIIEATTRQTAPQAESKPVETPETDAGEAKANTAAVIPQEAIKVIEIVKPENFRYEGLNDYVQIYEYCAFSPKKWRMEARRANKKEFVEIAYSEFFKQARIAVSHVEFQQKRANSEKHAMLSTLDYRAEKVNADGVTYVVKSVPVHWHNGETLTYWQAVSRAIDEAEQELCRQEHRPEYSVKPEVTNVLKECVLPLWNSKVLASTTAEQFIAAVTYADFAPYYFDGKKQRTGYFIYCLSKIMGEQWAKDALNRLNDSNASLKAFQRRPIKELKDAMQGIRITSESGKKLKTDMRTQYTDKQTNKPFYKSFLYSA